MNDSQVNEATTSDQYQPNQSDGSYTLEQSQIDTLMSPSENDTQMSTSETVPLMSTSENGPLMSISQNDPLMSRLTNTIPTVNPLDSKNSPETPIPKEENSFSHLSETCNTYIAQSDWPDTHAQ